MRQTEHSTVWERSEPPVPAFCSTKQLIMMVKKPYSMVVQNRRLWWYKPIDYGEVPEEEGSHRPPKDGLYASPIQCSTKQYIRLAQYMRKKGSHRPPKDGLGLPTLANACESPIGESVSADTGALAFPDAHPPRHLPASSAKKMILNVYNASIAY